MKKIKSFIFLSLLALGLNSCENELVDTNSTQNFKDEVTIKNGRLSFQSKEAFEKVFKEYSEATDEKISNYFKPLYEKGFYSLRPIATEQNEKFLYDHYIKLIRNNTMRGNTNKSSEEIFDYFDDLEDIIGDDTFSAFLNNEAEIQVADEIYKYTDVGLFISKEDKFSIMEDLLDAKNISKDLTIKTSLNAKQAILNEYPNEGITNINGDISYFKILPNLPDDGGSGGGGGTYTPAPGSPASSDPSYNVFLNNLSSCTPHSGLFGNLFGDNDVCIDRYENRQRVKTKAFNYNYLLVYHLGVKCVHQYRGWTGFWRVDSADEIRLVVEAAQFEYDLDALTGNNAITNQTRERSYFMNNQKAFFSGPNTITFNNQWNTPIVTYQNLTSLPQIFQDNLTIEFFSTGWDWLDGQVQNGIDNNTEASKFNEWFYNDYIQPLHLNYKQPLGIMQHLPQIELLLLNFHKTAKW